MKAKSYWTNTSVLSMAGADDPIASITKRARSVVLKFLEAGGAGPPFDPFELTSYLNIPVVPRDNVRDARTVYHNGKLQIEFNPNRPNSRVRYSIAHEIVHTLFPDCKDSIRNRATHEEMSGDDWQLEMLCNIGASEILMPIGSFSELQKRKLSIDNLLEIRALYQVSIEALLLRFVRLTETSCSIFSASRVSPDSERYKLDYSISSNSFNARFSNGSLLPKDSVVSECTAIGFTAKSKKGEKWIESELLKVECVGIPPYPTQKFPRVMGILRPSFEALKKQTNQPNFVRGDATEPRGTGNKIIAFVVNDKTPRWGAGFGLAIRKKWDFVQKAFEDWTEQNPHVFCLGNIHSSSIVDNLEAVQLICQRGYGQSSKPRIRYGDLQKCLQDLSVLAKERNASVHMPKIGSGEAQGNWSIILEMIEQTLCSTGVEVTIYELPNAKVSEQRQFSLNFLPDSQ